MVAVTAAAVNQQSHLSDKPLNGRTTLPVDVSSGASVARLSCKNVCCILDRKNRLIDDELILDVSSDFLEKKNSSCKDRKHACLTLSGEHRD